MRPAVIVAMLGDLLLGACGREPSRFDGPKDAGSPLGADAPGTAEDSSADGSAIVDSSGAVAFSPERGFRDGPFVLTLSSGAGRGRIRYTLDGSDPRASTSARDYVMPVRIDPDSPEGRAIHGAVAPAVVVRAVAGDVCDPLCPVSTHTYVFVEEVLFQADVSGGAFWGSTAMDPKLTGDPAFVRSLREALLGLPTISLASPHEGLFGAERGIYAHPEETWARPVSFEVLHADGRPSSQADCVLRLATPHPERRLGHKQSFNVFFPKPTTLPSLLGSGTTPVAVLRLRAGSNDRWNHDFEEPDLNRAAQFVRDEFGRRSQRDMGHLSASGGFAHLYINGIYWGVYNPVERVDGEFARLHVGGHAEDYDVVKQGDRLVAGSMDAWVEMLGVGDLQEEENHRRLEGYLDMVPFADYTLLNIWAGNLDWPGNNWRAVRKSRNRAPGDPQFRVFAWDLETTLGHVDIAGTVGVGGLQARLRRSPQYRRLFAERVRKHLVDPGGALTGERASSRYAAAAIEIANALPAEAARWGDDNQHASHKPATPDDWRRERDRLLREWFPGRTDLVLEQLRSQGLYP